MCVVVVTFPPRRSTEACLGVSHAALASPRCRHSKPKGPPPRLVCALPAARRACARNFSLGRWCWDRDASRRCASRYVRRMAADDHHERVSCFSFDIFQDLKFRDMSRRPAVPHQSLACASGRLRSGGMWRSGFRGTRRSRSHQTPYFALDAKQEVLAQICAAWIQYQLPMLDQGRQRLRRTMRAGVGRATSREPLPSLDRSRDNLGVERMRRKRRTGGCDGPDTHLWQSFLAGQVETQGSSVPIQSNHVLTQDRQKP